MQFLQWIINESDAKHWRETNGGTVLHIRFGKSSIELKPNVSTFTQMKNEFNFKASEVLRETVTERLLVLGWDELSERNQTQRWHEEQNMNFISQLQNGLQSASRAYTVKRT